MPKAMLIAGILAAVVFADSAAASPVYCGPRKTMLSTLDAGLHQQPTSVALTNDGQLLEVLKSDTDLSWAILITSPQGLSCIIAEGGDWQNKKADLVAQDPRL